MNKRQLQVQKSLLNSESQALKNLETSYTDALADINAFLNDLYSRKDTQNLQSIIYQIKYQKAIKKEIEAILDVLHKKNYESIDEFLQDCYKDGYIGTLFDLRGQGVPLIMPLDQEQMISAITLNSKLSAPLYNQLGFNIDVLKVDVCRELSRGIAQDLSYEEIARNLKNTTGVDYNKSARIAKTEGHRIQNEAAYNAQQKAIDRGADVMKQWDSTLDGKTRDTHRMLDGQIVGVDDYFKSESGYKALYPGGFGVPSEDCNCRCCILQRARWALEDGPLTKWDGFADKLMKFDSNQAYDDFKKTYWSKENIQYMNYVETLEKRYKTKDFNKILTDMTDQEYKHYKSLMDANPYFG